MATVLLMNGGGGDVASLTPFEKWDFPWVPAIIAIRCVFFWAGWMPEQTGKGAEGGNVVEIAPAAAQQNHVLYAVHRKPLISLFQIFFGATEIKI